MRRKISDTYSVDIDRIDAWLVSTYGIEYHMIGCDHWFFVERDDHDGAAKKLEELLNKVDGEATNQ